MKRAIALATSLAFIVILSACAARATPTPTPRPAPTPTHVVIAGACPTTLPAGSSRGLYRVEGQSMHPSFQHGQVFDFEVVPVSSLERGDVIVFHAPVIRKRADGCPRDFIKRIVGLPGDTIEVKEGSVYVNGVRLDEPYVAERRDSGSTDPLTIPDGEYYVLGDNRIASYDSRHWGTVPAQSVVGRLVTGSP